MAPAEWEVLRCGFGMTGGGQTDTRRLAVSLDTLMRFSARDLQRKYQLPPDKARWQDNLN